MTRMVVSFIFAMIGGALLGELRVAFGVMLFILSYGVWMDIRGPLDARRARDDRA